MQQLYDTTAPKKATNLSLNSDLLIKSRALNINLSATLEQALKHELAHGLKPINPLYKPTTPSLSRTAASVMNSENFNGSI